MAGASNSSRAVGRGRAVLVVLVAAVALFATSAPTWVRAAGSTALSARVDVAVSGTRASASIGAAAIVLLAAGGALALVGRMSRWVVVAVVVAAGALVVGASAGVIADPVPIARSVVSDRTGAGVLTGAARLTVFPYLTCALGLVVVAIGAWVARVSAAWSGTDRRRESPVATPDDDHSAWDALTRGVDPTDRSAP